MHRLQIRQTDAQLRAPPTVPQSYIRVRAVVWECGEGQTDTQTRVTTIHFASSTTHAKCCRTVRTACSLWSGHYIWFGMFRL